MNGAKYTAKAARKPFCFWFQPFLLLFVIVLLWRMLPVSALLFNSRVVQPLASPHVSYVKLDPAFASEALRMSMQTLRRTEHNYGNVITFEAVEPFEALRSPPLLEQGTVYPGKWGPDDIIPLAQDLPDLLYSSKLQSRYTMRKPQQQGIRTVVDPALQKAGFKLPDIKMDQLSGTGNLRFSVETDDDGAVVHVLMLSPGTESAFLIERLLYRERAEKASSGEIRIKWRTP